LSYCLPYFLDGPGLAMEVQKSLVSFIKNIFIYVSKMRNDETKVLRVALT